ncbi:MAG TPA: homoserine dehydrogenase [Anaerolineales bacterium]|nr:homoserine dehydrogenase [Anaerolineales bacterium]
MAPSIPLALIGFGNVGRAFARLLEDKRDELRQSFDLEWRVTAIATRRHGGAIDPKGIDLIEALRLVENDEALAPLAARPAPDEMTEFLRQSGAAVLFETTPVNYETGQPAVDHLRAALELGMHAVTANKGPVVHAYRQLTDLARSKGKHFYFEAAVMDGAPIFSLWRSALPGASVRGFRGVLNSTTNLILTLMEAGHEFDEAVAQAQTIGVAETDPSGDILGWDAAVKVAALVTVLMGTPLTPDRVKRQGIENIHSREIAAARRAGQRWKLICRAERRGNEIEASVGPEMLPPEDPLFTVAGTSSSITFDSDVLGKLTITEEDPGPVTTAFGLLADFINAVRTPVV